jgi:hypothetical protein
MQLARILLLVVVTDDSGTSFEPSGGFVAGLRLNSLWDGSRPGSQDSARGLPIGVVKSPGSRGRGLVSDVVVTTASFSRVFPVVIGKTAQDSGGGAYVRAKAARLNQTLFTLSE